MYCKSFRKADTLEAFDTPERTALMSDDVKFGPLLT